MAGSFTGNKRDREVVILIPALTKSRRSIIILISLYKIALMRSSTGGS